MERVCKNCKWYMYTAQQCRYWSCFRDGTPFHLKEGVGGKRIIIKNADILPDFCTAWEPIGRWVCLSSGYNSMCPVNVTDGVELFLIHADASEEVFRLVDYLNSFPVD